jgi:hypothetical protein
MSIRNDFEQNGYLSGIDVLSMGKARYYSEKCMAFIDSYGSHPGFSEWTYYRTELVLKWVAELASEESLSESIMSIDGYKMLI